MPMFGLLGLPHQFRLQEQGEDVHPIPRESPRGVGPQPSQTMGGLKQKRLGFYGRFNGGSLSQDSQDLGFNTFQYSNKSDLG